MAAELTAAQKDTLTQAGIDWEKLKGIPWAEFIKMVMSLIAIFAEKQAPLYGASAEDCKVACKDHFTLIKAVAECGEKCCS